MLPAGKEAGFGVGAPVYVRRHASAAAAGQPDAIGYAPSLARPLRAHCVRPNSFPMNLSRRFCAEQPLPRQGGSSATG